MKVLQRQAEGHFSEVRPVWKGRTAVVIAGGPSITAEDLALVEAARAADRVRVVAINDAYLVAPYADVHYAADSAWHDWHTAGIAKPALGLTADQVRERWALFAGEKCTIQSSGANVQDSRVHMLRNRDFPRYGMGLSLDPCALVTGRNSGFQGVNLVVLAGAARILLLGFDGHPMQDGRTHYCGGHPRTTPAAAYPLYIQAMSAAEAEIARAGVEVVNCSPGSWIDSFPKKRLAEVL